MKTIKIMLAEKLRPLFFGIFRDCRYKVAYGGRGGSKSWGFADMAIMRMLQGCVTIAVCRELATTIKDSVHQLLKDRIKFHGIGEQFDITDNEIRCLNTGSIVKYKHLHNNITEIKGLEGANICWIFEAQNVSGDSWKELDPTLRKQWCNACYSTIDPKTMWCEKCGVVLKDGEWSSPEIWIEFNTGTEDDFIYNFFITNKPENAGVVLINYTDNPWCPQSLIDLAEECQRKRPEEYRHIWLGEPSGRGARVFPKYTDGVDKNGHPIHLRGFDLEKVALHGQCFMAMDPATVYYPFILWGMRFPMGKEFGVLIYNEFPTRSYFDGKFFWEIRKTHSCTLEMR
jgi:phage terminase large subunit